MSFAETTLFSGREDRMIRERLAQRQQERAQAIAQLEKYNNPEIYPKINFLRRFERNTDAILTVSDTDENTIKTLLEKGMIRKLRAYNTGYTSLRLSSKGKAILERINARIQQFNDTVEQIDAEYDTDKQVDKQIRAGIIGIGITAALGIMGDGLDKQAVETPPICIETKDLDERDQPQAIENLRYITDTGDVVIIKDTCE